MGLLSPEEWYTLSEYCCDTLRRMRRNIQPQFAIKGLGDACADDWVAFSVHAEDEATAGAHAGECMDGHFRGGWDANPLTYLWVENASSRDLIIEAHVFPPGLGHWT